MKVFVSTVPFAKTNKVPVELLRNIGAELIFNPLNRKLTSNELSKMISDVDVLIAGTEEINKTVLGNARNLKLISRVGIGVDAIDLNAAKDFGVQVSFTPDAPAPAVAELTIGLMLSLLRNIHIANSQMHNGQWERYFGRRIPEITIGIIGIGRIGSRVIRRLESFGTPRILVNDISEIDKSISTLRLEVVDKETIYKEADLISLHVPLTSQTKNMITKKELNLMKADALLINVSRGGLINEIDLENVLRENRIAGAAIDVFDKEPYTGPLSELMNCILTCHMGSMSIDCRVRMEIEATQEAVRFFKNEQLRSLVPESEYVNQMD